MRTANPRRCCPHSPPGQLGSATGSGVWILPWRSGPAAPTGSSIKPHTAIAATDESLLSGPAFTSTPLVAECTSEHPAGRWIYALAMHANPGDEPISGEIQLESLSRHESGAQGRSESGLRGLQPMSWRGTGGMRRRRDWHPTPPFPSRSNREDWTFHVLAPVLGSGLASSVTSASS